MATVAEKIIASLPKKLSGWKTLRSADGADDAFRALKAAGVPVVTGNDAPAAEKQASISSPAGTPAPLPLSASFW